MVSSSFAESEGFEPPIRVIHIPHFECGSFDHSDNSPQKTGAKVLLFLTEGHKKESEAT